MRSEGIGVKLRKWSLKMKKVTPMSDEEFKAVREEMLRYLESLGFKIERRRG